MKEASGQSINFAKSEVTFSKNVSATDQQRLPLLLGVRIALGARTYLGVPSIIGRSEKNVFSYIKDRMRKCISSPWGGHSLSPAGREILIKFVLQSIPSYVMSAYLIPPSVYEELERMMNSYFWGSGGTQSKGIKWQSWEHLAKPKAKGGVDFLSCMIFT